MLEFRNKREIIGTIKRLPTEKKRELHMELRDIALNTSRRGLACAFIDTKTCKLGTTLITTQEDIDNYKDCVVLEAIQTPITKSQQPTKVLDYHWSDIVHQIEALYKEWN